MRSSHVYRGLGERLSRFYMRTHRPPSPRVQRVLLAVATITFIGGGWLAFASLDVSLADVRWAPLLVAALIGVPLTLLTSTFEYTTSARMLGHRAPLVPAIRLTVVSTAANLLPLPGAFLVRVHGLRSMGSRYGKALGSTAVVGIVWIGVSAVLAGALLAPAGSWIAAGILLAVGIPLLGLAYAWLRRSVLDVAERRRVAGLLVLVEVLAVLTNAGRLVLILIGLDVDASLNQTLVLAVSSSLAAAAGILPGGFGLRELIAAALAPLVGLPAAAGFVSPAINRVMGIVVLAPVTLALMLGIRQRGEGSDPAPSGGDAS
jgi:hypothetical protein